MRSALSKGLLLGCLLAAGPASAHKQVASERGILQFRADSTELLYEISFPPGPEAAHWRLLYDRDHNGRLSAEEYGLLARGMAEALKTRVKLFLEGNELPLRVIDAKVSATEASNPLTGKLQALVWLGAREMPPGLRKVEVEVKPIIDPAEPVLIRLEPDRSTIDSIVGVPQVSIDGGNKGIRMREGLHATILLNVPVANAHEGK